MSAEPHYAISNAGVQLLDRWEHANQALADVKRRLNQAEVELANATIELGKFMTPKDAKPGEQFHLAVGEGFLAVTPMEGNRYECKWRTRPSPRQLP